MTLEPQVELVRHARGLACAVALWCVCSPAQAQDAEARQQAADALFEQGRRLLREGRYPQACAKFEASQGLDPGLGSLLFLGECYEKVGKTASAWRAFAQAAALAEETHDVERGRLARIRSVALEPRLAKLSLRLVEYTRGLDLLDLTLNGVAVARRDLDLPIVVDPGQALLQVTAPGHQHWQARLQIHEGPSTLVLDVPALVRLDDRRESSLTGATALPPVGPAPEPAASGSGIRVLAVMVGAAGLVSSGVGVYYGVQAVDKAEQSKLLGNCPLADCCYARGLELRADARDHAHLADVAIGVGAALLFGGCILYWVAPSTAPGGTPLAYQVTLGAGEAGATLGLEATF